MPLCATPPSLPFHHVQKNIRYIQVLSITNTGHKSTRLHIQPPKNTSFHISSLTPTPLAPGLQAQIQIEYYSTSVLDVNDTITITSDTDNSSISVPIQVRRPCAIYSFPSQIDYGNILCDKQHSQDIFIKNTGTISGEFSLLPSGASEGGNEKRKGEVDISFSPSSITLAPGEEKAIKMNLTPKKEEYFVAVVQVKGTNACVLDVMNSVLVKGFGQKHKLCALDLEGNKLERISFGKSYFGSLLSSRFVLLNEGGLDLEFLTIYEDFLSPIGELLSSGDRDPRFGLHPSHFLSLSEMNRVLKPKERVEIDVSLFIPPVRRDRRHKNGEESVSVHHENTVTFVSNGGGGACALTVEVTCEVPEVEISPNSLSFGEVSCGEKKEMFVIVENMKGDMSVSFLLEKRPGIFFEPSKGVLGPKGKKSILVTFAPSRIGKYAERVDMLLGGGIRVDELPYKTGVYVTGMGLMKQGEGKRTKTGFKGIEATPATYGRSYDIAPSNVNDPVVREIGNLAGRLIPLDDTVPMSKEEIIPRAMKQKSLLGHGDVRRGEEEKNDMSDRVKVEKRRLQKIIDNKLNEDDHELTVLTLLEKANAVNEVNKPFIRYVFEKYLCDDVPVEEIRREEEESREVRVEKKFNDFYNNLSNKQQYNEFLSSMHQKRAREAKQRKNSKGERTLDDILFNELDSFSCTENNGNRCFISEKKMYREYLHSLLDSYKDMISRKLALPSKRGATVLSRARFGGDMQIIDANEKFICPRCASLPKKEYAPSKSSLLSDEEKAKEKCSLCLHEKSLSLLSLSPYVSNPKKHEREEKTHSDQMAIEKIFKDAPSKGRETELCSKLLSPSILPLISIGPSIINLGEINTHNICERTVSVFNDHSEPVLISHLPHPSLSITPASQVFPPKSSGGFRLSLLEDVPHQQEHTIAFKINNIHVSKVKVLYTSITPYLTVSKPHVSFNFPPSLSSLSLSSPIVLANPTNYPVEYSWSLPDKPHHYTLDVSTGIIPAHQSTTTNVTFCPISPIAPQLVETSLKLAVANGTPSVVKLTAAIPPPSLTLSRPSLDYQDVLIGDIHTRTITVFNNSDFSTYIELDKTTLPPAVSVSPSCGRIGENGSLDIVVTVCSYVPVVMEESIRFFVRGGYPLNVGIVANVIIPNVYVEETLFSFRSSSSSCAATLPFTVVNDSPFEVSVALDLRDYLEFSLVMGEDLKLEREIEKKEEKKPTGKREDKKGDDEKSEDKKLVKGAVKERYALENCVMRRCVEFIGKNGLQKEEKEENEMKLDKNLFVEEEGPINFYILTIQPLAQANLQLSFAPKGKGEYNAEVSLIYKGGLSPLDSLRTITGISSASLISLSSTIIDCGKKIYTEQNPTLNSNKLTLVNTSQQILSLEFVLPAAPIEVTPGSDIASSTSAAAMGSSNAVLTPHTPSTVAPISTNLSPFSLSQTKFTLYPREEVAVDIFFSPSKQGYHTMEIPIFLSHTVPSDQESIDVVPNEEAELVRLLEEYSSKPYTNIKLQGTGIAPNIHVDTSIITFLPVPCNVMSKTSFHIYSEGYHNHQVHVSVDNEENSIPINVAYPQGRSFSHSRKSLLVELSLSSATPVTFSTKAQVIIVESESEGKSALERLTIPIVGSIDHGLLHNEMYWSHQEYLNGPLLDYISMIESADKEEIVLLKREVENFSPWYPFSLLWNVTCPSKHSLVKSSYFKADIHEDQQGFLKGFLLDKIKRLEKEWNTLRGFYNVICGGGGLRLEEAGQMDIQNTGKAILSFLNVLLSKGKTEERIDDQNKKEEKGERSSAIMKKKNNRSDEFGFAKERGDKVNAGSKKTVDSLLAMMNKYGCFTCMIDTSLLRSMSEFLAETDGSLAPLLLSVPPSQHSFFKLTLYKLGHLASWNYLLAQVIDKFLLSTVNQASLVQSPTYHFSEKLLHSYTFERLLPSSPSAALEKSYTPTEYRKQKEKILTNSYAASSGEKHLLMWMNTAYLVSDCGATPRLLSQFDDSLTDGIVYASCLLATLPEFAMTLLPSFRMSCTSQSQKKENFQKIQALLSLLQIESSLLDEDFLTSLTMSSGRNHLLFSLYLWIQLQQLQNISHVAIEGKLGSVASRSIEISETSISRALLSNETDFSVDAKSDAITLRFHPRSMANVKGRLLVIGKEKEKGEEKKQEDKKVEDKRDDRGLDKRRTRILCFGIEGEVTGKEYVKSCTMEAKIGETERLTCSFESPLNIGGEFNVSLSTSFTSKKNLKVKNPYLLPFVVTCNEKKAYINPKGNVTLHFEFFPLQVGTYTTIIRLHDNQGDEMFLELNSTALPPQNENVVITGEDDYRKEISVNPNGIFEKLKARINEKFTSLFPPRQDVTFASTDYVNASIPNSIPLIYHLECSDPIIRVPKFLCLQSGDKGGTQVDYINSVFKTLVTNRKGLGLSTKLGASSISKAPVRSLNNDSHTANKETSFPTNKEGGVSNLSVSTADGLGDNSLRRKSDARGLQKSSVTTTKSLLSRGAKETVNVNTTAKENLPMDKVNITLEDISTYTPEHYATKMKESLNIGPSLASVTQEKDSSEQQVLISSLYAVDRLPFQVVNSDKMPSGTHKAIVVARSLFDERVFEVSIHVAEPPIISVVSFACPALKKVTQELPIAIPAEGGSLRLHLSEEREGRIDDKGKRSVREEPKLEKTAAPANWFHCNTDLSPKKGAGVMYIPVTFKPQFIGVRNTSLFATVGDKRYIYQLEGIGETSLSEGHIQIECVKKTTTNITVVVTNPSNSSCEYTFQSDIPFITSAEPKFVLKGKSRKEITLSALPMDVGTRMGTIAFANNDMGMYLWYTVTVYTSSSPPYEKLLIEGETHHPSIITVPIENPLNEKITFNVSYNKEIFSTPPPSSTLQETASVPGLYTSPSGDMISLEGKQKGEVKLLYTALFARESVEEVIFSHLKVGEKVCQVELRTREASPQALRHTTHELGDETSIPVIVINPIEKEVTFEITSSNEDVFFSQEPTLTLKAKETKTVPISYRPSSLERETAIISLNSTTAGNLHYSLSGNGLAPVTPISVVIDSAVNSSKIKNLLFKNPFPSPIMISIEFISSRKASPPMRKNSSLPKNSTISSLSSIATDSFTMLLKKNEHWIEPRGSLQIPIRFSPLISHQQHSSTLTVSTVQNGQNIQWTYSLSGLLVNQSSTDTITISTPCRTAKNETLLLPLTGVPSALINHLRQQIQNPSALSRVANLACSVRGSKGEDRLLNQLVSVSLGYPTFDAQGNLIVNLRFLPLKPLSLHCELVIDSLPLVTSTMGRDNKSEKSLRAGYSMRNATEDRRERSERGDRSERGERWDRSERGDRSERWDKSERGDDETEWEQGSGNGASGQSMVFPHGKFIFDLHLKSNIQEYDDVITIASQLNSSKTIEFFLKNCENQDTSFRAYFSPNFSSSNFTVSPSSGVLPAANSTSNGKAIQVTYSRDSFKIQEVCELCIETDIFCWTYKIVGVLVNSTKRKNRLPSSLPSIH